MKTLGAVLVGGASTRFGSDKSLARLGDTTMLQVIHETLLAAGL
ncbi:MAG: NTP transferase domain-containing protein, partial [Ilumatobacteraceae bacterium]